MNVRTRWTHLLLAGAAAIACGALLGCGTEDTGGGEETDAAAAEPAAAGEPDATDAAAEPAVAGEPEATEAPGPAETGPADRRLSLNVPQDAYPVVWVRQGAEVEIHTEPGGGGTVAKRVGRRTEFGSPSVFGVVRRSGDWAAVMTPYLPNGELGWVQLDARKLDSGWTDRSIVVDLSERRAELRTAGKVQMSFVVTVGMPGAETPTGRFGVTDTFRGKLNPAYGCCAVALSARQPHLPSGWLGGNRIAIHGTSGPLGVAVSHGCVRAADPDVNALVNKVPLGTPVFVRA